MESATITIDKIVEGLCLDQHFCNKELFAFVNRMLGLYGHRARILIISDDMVEFTVEDGFNDAA